MRFPPCRRRRPVLRIPRNYYDDLAARYALPDEQIDAMRKHNILYDRDERGGEFFHAYTEQLDQRFFLEVSSGAAVTTATARRTRQCGSRRMRSCRRRVADEGVRRSLTDD